MHLDDLLGKAQADTGAFFLGGEEGMNIFFLCFSIDTRTIINDLDRYLLAIPKGNSTR